MLSNKQQIINLFRANVRGKTPDVSKKSQGHDGKVGHWLEEQFNIAHNADNLADLFGYELKNQTKSKTTFGDWSANEYIYNCNKYAHLFSESDSIARRDKFMRIFGHSNSQKGGRYSWSGEPCPKISGFNKFGQKLEIDVNNDIIAVYNYKFDCRPNKSEIIPLEFQKEEIVIARWYGESVPNGATGKCLKDKVENKFNQEGWFVCKTGADGRYNEICFGSPINYETFLKLVKTGDIFFDSGMHEGNSRPYSQWRMNNSGWNRLIVERYS